MEIKTPPFDEDLEKMILGSLIAEENTINKVIDILKPEHFYVNNNRIIYESILELYKKNKAIDIITVNDTVSKNKCEIDSYYIASLLSNIGSCSHIEYHVKILIQKAIRRKIIEISNDLLEKSYDNTIDTKDLIDDATKYIDKITKSILTNKKEKYIGEILPELYNEIEEKQALGNGISGLSSGFTDIDKITNGFQQGQMIIIGARPSMGKTAFSLSIAVRIARMGNPVLFFSLEMTEKQISKRILANITEINSYKFSNGDLTDYDWNNIENKTPILQNLPLIIDDEGGIDTLTLISKCKNYTQKYGIKIIIIDYLQLMHGTAKNQNQNREREIAEISATIKKLAKDLNITIIALSQLNRAVDDRPNHIPILSDLRDSGSIEQDADIIGFIYRPEKYGIEETEDCLPTKDLGQLIIAKNRDGEIGTINLKFNAKCVKFEEFNF